MRVQTISVGTELLAGTVTDTNAGYICRSLAEAGFRSELHTVVGDDVALIEAAVWRSLSAQVVIVTGGPGRTHDDLIRTALSRVVGRELQAPGIDLVHEGARIFVLPGVPGAMEAMLADHVLPAVRRALAEFGVAAGNQTLEGLVVELARGAQARIGVAESFTGGLVTSRIVSVPGASDVLAGSVVAYSAETKVRLLGVPPGLIAEHGVVSAPVARAMAEGARAATGADVAVSTTGEAGPEAAEKPVGTVFVGRADRDGASVQELFFSGGRQEIRAAGATAALRRLRDILGGRESG